MSEYEPPVSPNADLRLVRREEVTFRASQSLSHGLNTLLRGEYRTDIPWTFRSEEVAYFGMQKAMSGRFQEKLERRKEHVRTIGRVPLQVNNPQFAVVKGTDTMRVYFEPSNPQYLDTITRQLTDMRENLNLAPSHFKSPMLYTELAIHALVPDSGHRRAREALYEQLSQHPDLYSVTVDAITGREMYRPEPLLRPEIEELPHEFFDDETPDVA